MGGDRAARLPVSQALARMCRELAGTPSERTRSPAANGCVIAEKSMQQKFFNWANAQLAEQPSDFAQRFAWALRGLLRAARGESSDSPPAARRFLGWSVDKHWLHSSAKDA